MRHASGGEGGTGGTGWVGREVDTAGGWAWPQRHLSLPQAWPVVADQRGPELCLHHPSPQGPQTPGRWLLTLTSPLFYLSSPQVTPCFLCIKSLPFWALSPPASWVGRAEMA